MRFFHFFITLILSALMCVACVRVVTHHPTYYRVRYLNEGSGVHHVAVDRVKGGYCTKGRDRRGKRVFGATCWRRLASPSGVVRNERLFSHENDIVEEAQRLVQQKCPGVVYQVEEDLGLPLESMEGLKNKPEHLARSLAFRCGNMNDIADLPSPFSEGDEPAPDEQREKAAAVEELDTRKPAARAKPQGPSQKLTEPQSSATSQKKGKPQKKEQPQKQQKSQEKGKL